ncbi:helix-turn-helix transcriptional regulator [Bacillus atrophaeus]|uniref:helix-turn-helix domain-containing protein n=1 Tax=Bacillus atrophaeus TaxID=1452 RepID=UPI00228193A6|nr:helix-turn-helix transcriptional regulator [Bacillus atrophaeus]MCY9198064.1 helix-turn-helix transcriptional regulator [Bacillus atrophaeus]
MNFGEKIKHLRDKNNKMTQKELAELTGLTQGTLSKFENNVKEPGLPAVKKIAKVFNVSTDYLLGYTDDSVKYSESEKSFVNEYTKLFPSELNIKVNELAEEYKTDDNGESVLTKDEAEEAVRYIKYLLSQRRDKT